MAKRSGSTYEELFSREKEGVLDQLARAQAGQEGRPAFSRRPNATVEAEAWNGTDPAVTDQHMAEIAMQTVQELAQQRDEQGMPLWSLEQIDLEARYRQSIALHPHRPKVYTPGFREDDFEGMAKAAERAARRYGQTIASPADGGWSEPMDEDEMPVAGAAPVQQSEQPEMYGEEAY